MVKAEGEGSRLSVTVAGVSAAANPKSSAIVGLSVLSALANAAAVCTHVREGVDDMNTTRAGVAEEAGGRPSFEHRIRLSI